MRIGIEDLRAFVLVADIKNFHRAAEELAITQPALSRRLKKMEDVLQVRLLDRTSRIVELTTIGEEFLPTATRMVREFERSMGDIQDIIEKRAGVVTMASVLTIAQNVLPLVVAQFNEQFPLVSVRVMDDVGPKVADLVASGDAEFGIACREDHPLARKRRVTWADLQKHTYIRMGADAGNQRKLESVLGDSGVLPIGTHEVAHISTLLSFVGAGLGISAVPKLATVQRPDLKLVFRPIVDPVVSRTIGLIKPVGRTLSPSALALSNIAADMLQQFAAADI
jgi:DNA-binding transcriptional LysR family regulator